MSEKRGKKLGTFVFLILILLLIYLVFFLAKSNGMEKTEMIEIAGNNLLNEKDYLNFVMLRSAAELGGVSLPVIKDRFEKHPYIKSASIELSGNKKISVLLEEKKIMAVVLIEPEPYFITEDFQILPMFINTRFIDVPVISNPGYIRNHRPLNYVKTDALVQAFKIIDAIKLTNQRISSSLSEINLRNGGDIILTFSGLRAPVIFGKNGAAKKMIYLEMLWDKMLAGKALVDNSEYVDLRFANEIFIGSAEKTGLLK